MREGLSTAFIWLWPNGYKGNDRGFTSEIHTVYKTQPCLRSPTSKRPLVRRMLPSLIAASSRSRFPGLSQRWEGPFSMAQIRPIGDALSGRKVAFVSVFAHEDPERKDTPHRSSSEDTASSFPAGVRMDRALLLERRFWVSHPRRNGEHSWCCSRIPTQSRRNSVPELRQAS